MDSRAQEGAQGSAIVVQELSHERRYFFKTDPAINEIRTAAQRKKILMDKYKYIASMEADDSVPVLLRILLEIEDELNAQLPEADLIEPQSTPKYSTKSTVKKAIEMFAESDESMRTLRKASSLELPGLLLRLNEKIDGAKIRGELDQIKIMTAQINVDSATHLLWKEACHYMRGLYHRRADAPDLDSCRDKNGYPQKGKGEYPTKGLVDMYFFGKTGLTKMDVCDAYNQFADNIESRIKIYEDAVKKAAEIEGQNDEGIPARLRLTKKDETRLELTVEVADGQLPKLQKIIDHARQLSCNPLLKTQLDYLSSSDDVRIKMLEAALTQKYKLLDSQVRGLRNFFGDMNAALENYLETCKRNISAKSMVPGAILPDFLNNTHTQLCRDAKARLAKADGDIQLELMIAIDVWHELNNKKSKTLLPEIHQILMDVLNILFPPSVGFQAVAALRPVEVMEMPHSSSDLKVEKLSEDRENYYKFKDELRAHRSSMQDKVQESVNPDLQLPAAIQALLDINEKYSALDAVVESKFENAGYEIAASDCKINLMTHTKMFLHHAVSILGELDEFESTFKALGITDIALRAALGERIKGDRIEEALKELISSSKFIEITEDSYKRWKEVIAFLEATYSSAVMKAKCKMINGVPQKQDGHYPFVNKADAFLFEKAKLTKVDVSKYCHDIALSISQVVASYEAKAQKNAGESNHPADEIPCCLRVIRKGNKSIMVAETTSDNVIFLNNVHDYARAMFNNPFLDAVSEHRKSKDDIRLKNLKSLVEDDKLTLLAFDANKLCNFKQDIVRVLDTYIKNTVIPTGYSLGLFDKTHHTLCETAKRDLASAKGDVKLELLIVLTLWKSLAGKSTNLLPEVRKLLLDAINILCPANVLANVLSVQQHKPANPGEGKRLYGFGSYQ
jgi:hypothetical protein